MKPKREHSWVELFESDNGGLSMTRLLCFMSFFPASYVVVIDKGEGTLGWYLGAYVLGYVGGKGADALMIRKEKRHVSDDSLVPKE